MNESLISSHLAALTGNLKDSGTSGEHALDNVRQIMAGTLHRQDVQSFRNKKFSFEGTDFFTRQKVEAPEQAKMDEAVQLSLKDPNIGKNTQVFVRDVPVRSTQIKGSIPEWAAGAMLEKSAGPFLSKDGRHIWVDFYRTVEKSVAIYIQGQALPAIIFTGIFKQIGGIHPGGTEKPEGGIKPGTELKPGFTLKPGLAIKPGITLKPNLVVKPGETIKPAGAIKPGALAHEGVAEAAAAGLAGQGIFHSHPEAAGKYTVADGSVWINSRILSATAPVDRYCGLKVKGGAISLDIAPVIQNDKLIIQPGNNVEVSLELVQQDAPAGIPAGSHGIDARNARFTLPGKFVFSFRGSAHVFREIGAAAWMLYGQKAGFTWNKDQNAQYDALLSKVLIPLHCDINTFEIEECLSPFNKVGGKAGIKNSFWGLPAAVLDVTNPMEAYGSGALIMNCGKGLRSHWKPMTGADARLGAPQIIGEPGRIGISDAASDTPGATHTFDLWKDDLNPRGTSVDIRYLKAAVYFLNTFSIGDEVLITGCNADFHNDRPVKVNGEPVNVNSKNSAIVLGANDQLRLVYLYDDNIIWDNLTPFEKVPAQKAFAIALDNALFTVSPVNGCLLFGKADENWKKIVRGNLWLVFGMYAYLPTLPDPYAANLAHLKRRYNLTADFDPAKRTIAYWLACRVGFEKTDETKDQVDVTFHFSGVPTGEEKSAENPASQYSVLKDNIPGDFKIELTEKTTPEYQEEWEKKFGYLERDAFSLLDVSSNANQFGVSFNSFGDRQWAMMPTATFVKSETDATVNNTLPFVVEGMEVKSQGKNVRIFTLPEIAWEPVVNLTPPDLPAPGGMDPDKGFNYYPNDGGPTRIFNNSKDLVALAPIPALNFLVNEFEKDPSNITIASFTLPFGIKAVAIISKNADEPRKPQLEIERPNFKHLLGGFQIRATAGNHGIIDTNEPRKSDSNMFPGYTLQLNNILNLEGISNKTSTLGDSVSVIFNKEFWTDPLNQGKIRGVPVEQIDFSGYGASMFSNWLSPSAAIAKTSQARFDVLLGRTSHEVIQVRSILYPWGIHVVRTITLFRVSSGYVYRHDSGWKAESDGKFDFRYSSYQGTIKNLHGSPYEFHPGVVKGLFNVRNIKEDPAIAEFNSFQTYVAGDTIVDVTGQDCTVTSAYNDQVKCRGVWFDADVEIENVVQGHVSNRVVSKKILGYVQLAPSGEPLRLKTFKELMELQGGSIGGVLDCVISINGIKDITVTEGTFKPMQMRLNRFDVSISTDKTDTGTPVFAAAARGSILLPKDGSWSVVQHEAATGNVTPLSENASVPLIREGKLDQHTLEPASTEKKMLRIANPMELVRPAGSNTVNLGLLQTTATQKALFLTPAFKEGHPNLMSKTPPLFADAYRLMTGNGIFPNIGTAANGDFGKVIPMLMGDNHQNAFTNNPLNLEDAGETVLDLLAINPVSGDEIVDQGMTLLKKVTEFDIPGFDPSDIDFPSFNIPLVETKSLKIYIEYSAKTSGSNVDPGKLNFDVDSTQKLEDTCKSKLNNLAMVVDLGTMTRLMTIKGNFNSSKGKESGYEGGTAGLPAPKIEFSKDLQPVIDLLQMLASLSSGDYLAVLQKGLKIAMGNSGEIWEYKFEAKKEIPLIRFPSSDELYNSPSTPLKLEASLALGFYFSAALRATTDTSQLVPTAGAFVQFHGGLSVLCMSMGYGSIYAMGSVDVKIACDTLVGPSLTLKFGFGAEIVVGLPVVGHVSIIFMVGVEMYADANKISITGLLFFRGNAELLGGLVCVTITIEAKGTIERTEETTSCTAEVTFGLDISIFWIINISFCETWSEQREIA